MPRFSDTWVFENMAGNLLSRAGGASADGGVRVMGLYGLPDKRRTRERIERAYEADAGWPGGAAGEQP